MRIVILVLAYKLEAAQIYMPWTKEEPSREALASLNNLGNTKYEDVNEHGC